MKFDKLIEAVLALLLIYQSVLYLIISFQMVDPWIFPTSVLFLGPCVLGAIIGFVGVCRLVQRVLQGEAIRLQAAHLILKSDTDSIVLPVSSLVTKRIVIKTLNKMGWRVVRRFSETMDNNFKEVYEIVGGMAGSPRRTDLLVRLVSVNESSTVVDIRSSSPGRRRDLGFNELMIRNFTEELSKAVPKDQLTMTSLGLFSALQLL